MESVRRNAHSSLFPQNLKFLFLQKSREIGGNEIRFNDLFTKTPKIPIVRTNFDLDPTQEWIQAHVAQTMNL